MMGGGVGTILTLVVLGLVVWAIIKFVPDWQDRVGLRACLVSERVGPAGAKSAPPMGTAGCF